MSEAISRCQLDLSGSIVLTEAASGAYVVTPVLAAMAGAEQVYALTRSSRYGTVEEIKAETFRLAEAAGQRQRIEVISEKSQKIFSQADIITNSGHLRPLDAEMLSWTKPTAVIPLMFEAWEFRPEDIDLEACWQQGIPVAGTNERHPAIDVFSFLGCMAVKLLWDAGVAVYGSKVLLLCDNPFRSFLMKGLTQAGARIEVADCLDSVSKMEPKDAILVALQPQASPVISAVEANLISECYPGTVAVQFWGDVDRTALAQAGVPYWPVEAPPLGHMAVLPSALGPEPVVRLQAGGLKVAEIMYRVRVSGSRAKGWPEAIQAAVDSGFGQALDFVKQT